MNKERDNTVRKIKRLLGLIGSKFSTSDGETLLMPVSADAEGTVFLRKVFSSPEKCLEFVEEVAKRNGVCV